MRQTTTRPTEQELIDLRRELEAAIARHETNLSIARRALEMVCSQLVDLRKAQE